MILLVSFSLFIDSCFFFFFFFCSCWELKIYWLFLTSPSPAMNDFFTAYDGPNWFTKTGWVFFFILFFFIFIYIKRPLLSFYFLLLFLGYWVSLPFTFS